MISERLGNQSRLVLVGYSYGCGPAAQVALELSKRIYSIALISPMTTKMAGVAVSNNFAVDALARWTKPAFFAAGAVDVFSDPQKLPLLQSAGQPPRLAIVPGADHFYRSPFALGHLVKVLTTWLLDIIGVFVVTV